MWSKDLLNELIRSVQALPEQIGEVLERRVPGDSVPGKEDERRLPGKGSPDDFATLAKNLENAFGALGRVIPGLGQLAGILKTLRVSAESLQRLQDSFRTFNGSGKQERPESREHATRDSFRSREAWVRSVLQAAQAESARRSAGGWSRERAEWVKTVLNAKDRSSQWDWAKPRGSRADTETRGRAKWVDTVLNAKDMWGGGLKPKEGWVSSSFWQDADKKPKRPPGGSSATQAAPEMTLAAVRRYRAYGSLGGTDWLGRLLDSHKTLRAWATGAMPEPGAVPRLGRGPGGAGGGLVPLGQDPARQPGTALVPLASQALKPAAGRALEALGEGVQRGGFGFFGRLAGIAAGAGGIGRGGAGLIGGGGIAGLLPGPGGAAAAAAGIGGTGAAAIAAPLTATLAAIAAVGTALYVIPPKLEKFSERILESNRSVSQFSGEMATVFANYDVRGIYRSMRMAQGTVATTATLAGATGDLQDALVPERTFFQNLRNRAGIFAAGLGESLANIGGPLAGRLNDFLQERDPGGNLFLGAGKAVLPFLQALGGHGIQAMPGWIAAIAALQGNAGERPGENTWMAGFLEQTRSNALGKPLRQPRPIPWPDEGKKK